MLVVGLVLYSAWVLFGPADPNTLRDDWFNSAIQVYATALVLWRAAKPYPDRLVWAFIGLGMFLWTAGDIIFVFYFAKFDPIPFPTISDGLFLMLYPCVAGSLVLLLYYRIGSAPIGAWFDGMLVALATAAFGWLAIKSIVDNSSGSQAAIITNAAFPIADMALLCLLVGIFSFLGWRAGAMWWCLAAGIVLFTVTDTVYLWQIAASTYQVGSVVDIGWTVGLVVIAAAAWLPYGTVRSVPVLRRQFIVPVIIAIAAFALMIYATIQSVPVGSVILAAASIVAGSVGLLVTERIALRTAEHDRAVAEEAARAKAQFLANMSHEIRTPMNGVLGMLEMLTLDELSAKQLEYVSVAQSSAETMLVVINDILDFSKLEAGKMALEHIPFDVRDSVEDVTALCSTQAAAKGLEVSCYFPTDVCPDVLGDPNRLRQVLVNLVGNAVKFTHVGEVAVSVSQVGVPGSDIRLRFEVRDTGIGISAQTRARLFDSFSQGDASTTRQFGGTGLGLTISQQLVTLMGGTVDVQSREGEGTTFAVELDFDRQGGVGSTLAPIVGAADLKVLVVDDHDTSRDVLCRYLHDWGMATVAIAGGPAALKLLAESSADDPFDVAFVDARLPGEQGSTLASTIKDDARTRGTRLVLLSPAWWPEGTAAVGQSEYSISKPVRQSVLHAVALSLVQPPQARESATTQPVVPPPSALPDLAGDVLLVEDNSVNQRVAKGMLARLGLSVTIVGDGAEALQMLAVRKFDLVLMDCQMPVMDGFAATREFRRTEPAGQRTPIVALTAGVMSGAEAACHLAGMDSYLSKPYRLSELRAAIEPWLTAVPG